MDCPAENAAVADRTGTTSSMTSQAAALGQTAPAPADDSTVANAAMAMDVALRDQLAQLVEMEAELALEVEGTAPALVPPGDTGELIESEEDEGPLDALEQFEDNGDNPDQGIPQEILDLPINPAAATGDKPAEKADEPEAKKPVEEPAKPAEPAPEADPKDIKAEEAVKTETPDDAKDADADKSGIDTTGKTPEEILAEAAAAAGGDDVPGEAAEAATNAPVDMGASTAMTGDMCPMEAAEMMMAGETETAMSDIATDMAADTDMMSEDMATDDMG